MKHFLLSSIKKHKVSSLILGLYWLYFCLLFLQFPAHHSLPGQADTIFNEAMFNDYWNRIVAFVHRTPIGNSYYPERSMQQFSELYLGDAAIYIFFKFFFGGTILPYYFFLCTLFTLNSFGAFLFSRFFLKNNWNAFVVGFIFGSSSFAFSQIDLLNGIAYFFFFLSLLYVAKYSIEKPSLRHILIAAFCAAAQLYFSIYIFIYLCLCALLLTLCYQPAILTRLSFYKHILVAVVVGCVLIFPYLFIADFDRLVLKSYNPVNLDIIGRFSLNLSDFIRHMPNHRLYAFDLFNSMKVIKNTNYVFLGFSTYILLIVGLFSTNIKKILFPLILLILGVLLGFGPYIEIRHIIYKAPMYFFYTRLGFDHILRIPARTVSLSIFGIAMILGHLLSKWEGRKLYLFSSLFLLIFFLENVPKEFNTYPSLQYISPPTDIGQYFNKIDHKKDVILAILPSTLFTSRGFNQYGISEFTREYIYESWQTSLKVNMINGSSGYFPQSRMENNKYLTHIYSKETLIKLIIANNLSHICYTKSKYLKISADDIDLSAYLDEMDFLEKTVSSTDADLYVVKKTALQIKP